MNKDGMTVDEYRAMFKSESPFSGYKKYRNKVVKCEDGKFDSKAEYKRWQELKLYEKANAISGIRRQVRFDCSVNGIHICDYVSDFVYQKGLETIVEDVKGKDTAVYRIKKKLLFACLGIIIREVRYGGNNSINGRAVGSMLPKRASSKRNVPTAV